MTLLARNSADLVAEVQLTINLEDENNLAPIFTNIESGSVLENEPPGAVVMTVSAVDFDGTYPNNHVTYKISDHNPSYIKNMFEINADTGVIKTLVTFDREVRAVYPVIIEAQDGAPSSLNRQFRHSTPNVTPQKFRIVIADKNDNAPYFPEQVYYAEVPEDLHIGTKVMELQSIDYDTEASITTYQIISGDPTKAFTIEDQTGFIRVARPLDFEAIKEYNLVVGALETNLLL